MNTALIQKASIPDERLRDLGVAAVYLFGSQAEGVSGPMSDIDIGIVSRDPSILPHSLGDVYQQLYDIFTDVFDTKDFKDIDIVFLDHASLELRFDAIMHGKVLFEADAHIRHDFEERTGALYRDFKPLRDASDRAVLQRV